MPEQAKEMCNAVDRTRLSGLMDKLVAVQLDLKPLCSGPSSHIPPTPADIKIAAACEDLQMAIEDLRDVIHGLGDFAEFGASSSAPQEPA